MKIFVTGAIGWACSAVVVELIHSGHQVTGLVRSSHQARALHDTPDELDRLRHRAIEIFRNALKGTSRPLLVIAGLAHIAPGGFVTEQDVSPAELGYSRQSETDANTLTARGVRTCIVQLAASVHGSGDHGFIASMIVMAREKACPPIWETKNSQASVHRSDTARLHRLTLEQAHPAPIYHAVINESFCCKDIVGVIGEQFGLSVESREHEYFGWLANFPGADMPAPSVHTRARLGQTPCSLDLLTDLRQGGYFAH